MLPFPGIERVLPFMESRLTLGSLHKGQTSQNTFAEVGAALRSSLTFASPHNWCQARPEVKNRINFLTFLPQARKEKRFPLKCGTWGTTAWLISGGTKCQLPIRGGSGHPMNFTFSRPQGGCAHFDPLLKREDNPLPPPRSVRCSGGCAPKNSHFKKQLKECPKSQKKGCFTFPKVTFCCEGQNDT